MRVPSFKTLPVPHFILFKSPIESLSPVKSPSAQTNCPQTNNIAREALMDGRTLTIRSTEGQANYHLFTRKQNTHVHLTLMLNTITNTHTLCK